MGEVNTNARRMGEQSEKHQKTSAPAGRPIGANNPRYNVRRKVKRKGDEGLLKQLTSWLLNNQAGTSQNRNSG